MVYNTRDGHEIIRGDWIRDDNGIWEVLYISGSGKIKIAEIIFHENDPECFFYGIEYYITSNDVKHMTFEHFNIYERR